ALLGSSRQRNSTLLVRVVLLRDLDAERVRAATTGLALAGRILVGALVGGVVVRRRGGRRDRVRLLHVAVVAGAEDANRDVRVRRPHLRRGRLGDAELLVARGLVGRLDPRPGPGLALARVLIGAVVVRG